MPRASPASWRRWEWRAGLNDRHGIQGAAGIRLWAVASTWRRWRRSWRWPCCSSSGTFINDNFFTVANLVNVMTRSAFIAIVAVGGTFVISAGGLDLSVGSMIGLRRRLMIMFMNSGAIGDRGRLIAIAMAAGDRLGAACGLFNGLIVTVGRIEPFIATLGTMGIFRGLTTWLSQGGAITLRRSDLQRSIGRSISATSSVRRATSSPIPSSSSPTAALGAFVFYRTPYGRHVVAVGSNEDVARYSGIPVNRGAHHHLRHPGDVRGDCGAALRAAPGLDLGDHAARCGNCRRSPRWSSAERRCAAASGASGERSAGRSSSRSSATSCCCRTSSASI